ncbi:hypothetical protein AAAC51_06835 [Priestia megaterium]
MKQYRFMGESIIRRKFSVDVVAEDYEAAESIAFDCLEDTENNQYYAVGDDHTLIEIEEYTERPLKECF